MGPALPSREHEETQMTRPIAPEDLFRFRFVVAADLSADGTRVVFAQTRIAPGEDEDDDEVEHTDLHLLDVESGNIRRLTFSDSTNSAPAISPDGAQVVFLSTRTEKPQLLLLPLDGGEPRQLTDLPQGVGGGAVWSPDGTKIAFTAGPQEEPRKPERPYRVTRTVGRIAYVVDIERDTVIGTRSSLYVLDPVTGARTRRGADIEGHIEGGIQPDNPGSSLGAGELLLTKGDRDAVVRVQTGGEVALVRVALDGDESNTVVAGGARACASVCVRGRRVLFGAFGFTEPADLHLLDLDTGEERRLTRLNDDVLAELELPAVVPLSFSSIDGAQVEGWFLQPPGAEGPLPTLLSIHGGPHGAWGAQFNFDHLMFAGAGYGVLLVNHRASTGYGDAFATATVGDWGNLDYADLMAGVDHAVEEGLADPDRLGVFGISGGGNLTGWVIGHTDRFKAACPENPVFNWFSMYGTSDVGADFSVRELGGTPYEAEEVYRRCSPIAYAHHCTTPTLFLQHESDYRCPAEQTEQFFAVLRVNGVPAEMLRFPDTPHSGSVIGPIGHRRAQNEALLDWMNRYVLDAAVESAEEQGAAATV